ncbi:family 3 glycosyl hydrolase, partial [Candidatus Bathyarchaeota archaeon]|nr:family 3 glycosyl hydrolase [Candidatus Bathyarchaeota archaeon]
MASSTTETGTGFDFPAAVEAVRSGTPLDTATASLLARLTPSERLWLLDGDEDFWSGLNDINTNGYNYEPYIHGAIPRLQIPGVRFADGPRGCVLGESTAFPVAMARGATWDSSLEERIGRAIGKECKAQGANFFGGVCVNLPRHPAWGRIQETYGEDPIILG